MTNINRTGTQHSKPAGDSPFPRDMAPKPPDQRKLGGKSDGTRRLAQERYPKSAGDFDRLIAQASTGQGQVNAPEYSEENAGIWRNIATDAARPIITRFTVSPTVFDNILCKADGVTYNTDIGRGECDGDLVLFLRSVQEEVVYRESLVSPFSKKRFHDTPEGVAALAEIDAEAIARGLKGAASVGSFRRDILGCPAPDFKASADEAHDRLHKWIEAHPVEVKSAPATTPALALALEVPVAADASGKVAVPDSQPAYREYDQGDPVDNLIVDDLLSLDFVPPDALPAPEPESFFSIPAISGPFFGRVIPRMREAGIAKVDDTDFMRAALGVKSRTEYKGTVEQAEGLIAAAIVKRNKPVDKQEMHSQEMKVTAPTRTAPTNNKDFQPKGYIAPTTPDEILNKYMVNLKGKWYLQVPGRVLMFRLAKPRGRIVTELLNATDEAAVFKAMVYDEDDRLLATGHARATFAGSQNFSGRVFEKAETAAIGRALAHAGYGTDQAGDDMDETDTEHGDMHLADSPR